MLESLINRGLIMKRSRRTTAFVALLVTFFIAASWGQPAQSSRQCYVKTIIGTAKVRKGNDAAWKEPRVRMALKEGDAVRTFVESEIEIETSEGTIMKVGENSTVEIPVFSSQAAGATNTKIKILAGNVLSDVKKLTGAGSKFEFETPTAVASIRGTRLGIDVTGDRTNVSVYEGRVFVIPRDAKEGAEVGANQTTTIIKGQRTIKVQNMGQPVPGGVDTTKHDSTGAKGAGVKDTSVHHDSTGFRRDTSASIMPKDTSTTARTRDSTQVTKPLFLAVTSPVKGTAFKPGDQVPVKGTVTPGATVTVNDVAARVTSTGQFSATYTLAVKSPDYDLAIEAALGGQTKSVILTLSSECVLTVTSPVDGMKLNRPLVPVIGTATPGTEVKVSGMKITVPATGTFSLEVPIADEENEMSVEIEAACNGQTKTVTRTVTYVPGIVVSVTAPAAQQTVNSTRIQISGMVTPAKASVSCQGTPLSKSANGAFSGFITIPDEEGSVDLEFEAVFGDQTKTVTQTIVYKRPADLLVPTIQPMSMPLFSKVNRLYFTVNDRTPGDEITFYRSIDGSTDNETNAPGSRFGLDLEEGYHDYVVYAKDVHGNESPRVSARVCYTSSNAWAIRMRKPLGSSEVLFIPQGPRNDNFEPKYTVQFSVVNLVNDDPKLLKSVSVTNTTTKEVQGEQIILDVDFEFDLAITRGVPNMFIVKVKDVNDIEKVSTFSLTVR
jgi:hypothetical protein